MKLTNSQEEYLKMINPAEFVEIQRGHFIC